MSVARYQRCVKCRRQLQAAQGPTVEATRKSVMMVFVCGTWWKL